MLEELASRSGSTEAFHGDDTAIEADILPPGSTGLRFHGVPGGHEFTSFVLGLYNAAGPGQAMDDEVKADIEKMSLGLQALAKEGIASICFDFGGHWKSEGKMELMTVGKEIEDALAMWEYAKSLPYVSRIGLLGHSQGGVVASMTAGILASRGESPAVLVLVAPGSVIQDACKGGRFFGAEFNPADPPEYVKCFGIMKLGREYILTTQELDIYGTAKAYTGPVRLIHGSKDTIVPMSCSERFVETYIQDAELIVVEGENHMITRKLRKVATHAVSFFTTKLK